MAQSVVPSNTAQKWIAAMDAAARIIPEDLDGVAMRRAIIEKATTELGRLGVDGDAFARYGMTARVLFPLLVSLGGGAPSEPMNGEGWRSLLELPKPGEPDFSTKFDAAWQRIFGDLEAWAFNAPLGEVLDFSPPTRARMGKYRLTQRPRPDVLEPYQWLWQRSVGTDVERWTDASLHLEFRWRHRVGPPPFPSVVLSHPGPDLTSLHEHIAGRAVLGESDNAYAGEVLFWQLQETAVDFLVKGKHDEAWALFHFYFRQKPDDPRVLNNLGFCRVPTDPEVALDWLEQASAGGYEFPSINVHNQCCCLVALNRLGDALMRAEAYWQRERREPSIDAAYIWRFENSDWTLDAGQRPEAALVELSIDVARRLGRTDRVVKWEQRLADISR